MKKITDYLEQLDLSESEAELYIKLIETGPISVKELAHKIGIKRTTAYLYIDRLIEKGLILKIVKGSRQQVEANPPDSSLQHLLETKTQTIRILQDEFPNIINEINLSFPKSNAVADAEIKYSKGRLGVRKMYEDALKANELRSYANLSEIENLIPGNYELFSEALTKNPNLILREIVNDTPSSRRLTKMFAQNKRYTFKFFPQNIKIPAADILIYNDKVGIINVKDKMSGILLQNTEYYIVSKELFDFIWSILPEEKA